jgi:hypothetical protein
MDLLIFPLIVVALGMSWWLAVHYTPTILPRFLPPGLTYYIGVFQFLLGAFGATYAVYVERDPGLFLGTLIQCFVGTWFMLAPTADQRGNPSDTIMTNFAAMLGACVAVFVLSFYLPQQHAEVFLQLWLVLFGAAVTLRPRLWSR